MILRVREKLGWIFLRDDGHALRGAAAEEGEGEVHVLNAEIRMPKSETSSNAEAWKTMLMFWVFGFHSDFDIRISAFARISFAQR
jgi:hypothetical protein